MVASAQILPQNNSPAATAPSSPAPIDNPYGLRINEPSKGETIYINGTSYFDNTGKKLSLPQKVSLKIAQYKVKKMVRNNRQVDLLSMARDVDTNNFDILGFILGVVLGPLGVLIAYLIEGKGSATFSWAIIGALVWLGLFLLVVLVL